MAKTSNRTRETWLSGIIGGPPETWPWWNCEPALQSKEQGRYPSTYSWRAGALSQPIVAER
jgi:hypothetical protein